MMRRIELEWDDENIDHIWEHRIIPEEIEEVLESRYLFERGRKGRYYVLGQSTTGRYLFVVMEQKSSALFRVITARDMKQSERKRYKERSK
jgi:uncharacterized DUF497 family protein